MILPSGRGWEILNRGMFCDASAWDCLWVTTSRPYGTVRLSNLYPGLRPGLSSAVPAGLILPSVGSHAHSLAEGSAFPRASRSGVLFSSRLTHTLKPSFADSYWRTAEVVPFVQVFFQPLKSLVDGSRFLSVLTESLRPLTTSICVDVGCNWYCTVCNPCFQRFVSQG